jgi:hypothetical protein
MSIRLGAWIVAAAAMAVPDGAHAQKTVVGVTGNVIRYLGDTIWVERDTTLRRTIYRGDTVTRASWLNDRLRTTETFVLRGDQALLIEFRDSTGNAVEFKAPLRPLPAMIATMDRRMLESELRMDDLRSRIGHAGDAMEPPVAPDPARTYRLSETRTLLHHRDTISITRNCSALRQTDTTVYLVFGWDSVRRVAPSPRSFGSAMAYALVGDMRTALVAELAATNTVALPPDLPRPGNGCGSPR